MTVPAHRMTPLKNAWLKLYEPVTENLKLDMRMNLKTHKVSARAELQGLLPCWLQQTRAVC